MTFLFYFSAAIAVVATLLAITRVNAVHALLYFICSLLATGVMFFVLGAPFVAALVVIINAGAIMVLFVFVVMMLNTDPQATDREKAQLRPRVWVGPALLSLLLLVELVYSLVAQPPPVGERQSQPRAAVLQEGGGATGQAVGPKLVGIALFGPYLLGVELASMLLLAGLLGAYHLGRGAVKSTGGRL